MITIYDSDQTPAGLQDDSGEIHSMDTESGKTLRGWLDNGVPGMISHMVGAVIVDMPTLVPTHDPMFGLALLEYFDRIGWSTSEEGADLVSNLSTAERVAEAIKDVAEPTEAQAEAGNYAKGHVTIQGIPITIETPAGRTRGKHETILAHHYGYIKQTEGADGDHVDVFIGPDPDSEIVFVIDQTDQDGSFDEHKCMLGFSNADAAVEGYLGNYPKGWRVGKVTALTMDDFKEWLDEGDTSKPLANWLVKNMAELLERETGLKATVVLGLDEVRNTRWASQSDPEQVKAFKAWFEAQTKTTLVGGAQESEEAYAKFLQQAYVKGATKSYDDVRKPALSLDPKDMQIGGKKEFLNGLFNRPASQEKLDILAQRTFNDLDGITDEMSTKITRELMDGLADGDSPREIAKAINKAVDIGQARALTMARTEIVRAHAEGQLAALKNLGVEELGVDVEWDTAGDDRVCEDCEDMEDMILDIDEASGLIPLHPNCRCAWVPYLPKPKGKLTKNLLINHRAMTRQFNARNVVWRNGRSPRERLQTFHEYLTTNQFCATGPGGGVDATCSPGDGGHQGIMGRIKDKVKAIYGRLEQRYGSNYAKAIIAAGMVGLPLPIPGSSAITAAPMIALAEMHRMFGHAMATNAVKHMTLEQINAAARELMEELKEEFPAGEDHEAIRNAFCPTGPGGGVDPTCSPTSGGASSEIAKAIAAEPKTQCPPPCHNPSEQSLVSGTVSRVGVAGMAVPPPPAVERLPNLTPRERQVENAFADAYEKAPDKIAGDYRSLVLQSTKPGEPPTFATDDAKVLSDAWNHSDPETRAQNRATLNLPLHATANAIAKRAFIQHLDTLKPGDEVLVTAGGCGAGKGYALKNVPEALALKEKSKAVWDSAGDQCATENKWIQHEVESRGLKANYLYVHADPLNSWANPKMGVVKRAGDPKDGRMVDAKVFADSYALGARNFNKFQHENDHNPNASFMFLENKGQPKMIPDMPKDALKVNRRELTDFAQTSAVISDAPSHVKRGATLGVRIWGSK